MPSAGRMRPKTTSPGSWITPITRPVSTRTLSSTLVNSPKNAFQSPATQSDTARSGRAAELPIMDSPFAYRTQINQISTAANSRPGWNWQHCQESRGRRHPAEDAALGFDHLQSHLIELGKVRG